MHRQEEMIMLNELVHTSRDARPETLSRAHERIKELRGLIEANAPTREEPGMLAGFWKVRFEIEGMKTQIAQMIESNTHAEDLRMLVERAIGGYDFAGRVKAAVNEHLTATLSQLVASTVRTALFDPKIEAALTGKLQSAMLESLKK